MMGGSVEPREEDRGVKKLGCGVGAVAMVSGCYSFLEVVFFFQAEDGIRDTSVTGVQTCALPILLNGPKQTRMRFHFLLFLVSRHIFHRRL